MVRNLLVVKNNINDIENIGNLIKLYKQNNLISIRLPKWDVFRLEVAKFVRWMS